MTKKNCFFYYSKFQSANALVTDAVGLYATAMNDLGNMESLKSDSLSCVSNRGWGDGVTFLKYIREVCTHFFVIFFSFYITKLIMEMILCLFVTKNLQAEYSGLTGEIQLDENMQRTNFKLDLLEKHRDSMIKTGMWHEDSGVNYTLSAEEADEIVVTKLENMTLRVVTAQVCIYVHPTRI